jgi:hypothetical protein
MIDKDVILIDRRSAALAFIVGLHLLTAACGSRLPPRPVPVPEKTADPESATPAATPEAVAQIAFDCPLIAESGDPVATVGLGEPVIAANAPHPSNDSERLLFRQMYETLVAIDCHGRALPGLATSWRLDADGRAWIVTLREGARFSDGVPVSSAEVRAAWTRDAATKELHSRVNRLVESVVLLDDRTLAITLRRRYADAPLALAHTDLAVARHIADSRWPLGTRASRIVDGNDAPAPARSVITLQRDGLSPVRFIVAPGDSRDLLDDGVDLLMTRDPAALDYAATLPRLQSIPMAWQRTLVLLTPTSTVSPLSDEARQALAEDAVRGEARGAAGPFWWQMLPDCQVAQSPPRGHASLTPRVVYDAGDSAARDLAERLVGLGRYQRAIGLTGDALARARRIGNDAGYVVALDSRPVDPCRELQVLNDNFRWLDPEAIVPLVDTRLQAIVRRGRSGLVAEWDGGLLLAGAMNRHNR